MSIWPKSRQLGFSLVELLVGILILSVLALVAMPSFQTWLQNSQIRNAAESIQNGLQRARAEAVARNTNVAFTLTGTDSSWSVYVVTPASGIDSRSSSEGSQNVTRTVTPPTATTVTFNNFGGVLTANPDPLVPPAPFTQVDLDSSVLAAAVSQNLRVTIGVGGNARMCDPNQTSGPAAC